MFSKILLAVEGSEIESTLPPAVSFARAYRAEVVVLHVLEDDPNHVEGSCADFVESIVARLERAGITALGAVRPGLLPDHVIAEAADECGADLIILSSGRHADFASLAGGSIGQHLLGLTACAVLVVPADAVAAAPALRELDFARR
jgi:nucleotide-binding universal stress UspA family protein